jgi:Nucleotidyl transferase AbiEii toxin, Type IV TA system
MTEVSTPELALPKIRDALVERQRAYALVGGLALAVRAEPRFTRDVDLAVRVRDDRDAEGLVRELGVLGYRVIATVEHAVAKRLSTVRLGSPHGAIVDLLFASCGIEHEVVERAEIADVPNVGQVSVCRAEELLAMKILSMRERRLQDRVDALKLLEVASIDLDVVRKNLHLITERGFHRDQDLEAKLQSLLDVRAADA